MRALADMHRRDVDAMSFILQRHSAPNLALLPPATLVGAKLMEGTGRCRLGDSRQVLSVSFRRPMLRAAGQRRILAPRSDFAVSRARLDQMRHRGLGVTGAFTRRLSRFASVHASVLVPRAKSNTCVPFLRPLW